MAASLSSIARALNPLMRDGMRLRYLYNSGHGSVGRGTGRGEELHVFPGWHGVGPFQANHRPESQRAQRGGHAPHHLQGARF